MSKQKLKKCYLIKSKKDNFLYGAFPMDEQGHKLAQEYIKKISKNYKNKEYFISKK